MGRARSCVVTGSASGIGRAIAGTLLAEGWSVVGIDVAEQLAESPSGPEIVPVRGDVSETGVLEEAARRAGELGPLEGWVNNAAVFTEAPVHEMSRADVSRSLEVNLVAAIEGTRIAIREMLAVSSAGSIVNVSSLQARQVVPGCAVYAAAKAGVEGFTRGAAVDCGRLGIRVNAVAPGTIATERYGDVLATLDDDERDRVEAALASVHALGRLGRPAEVAAVVAFLLRPESSNVTGAVVAVDGGRGAYAYEPR